jgi:hypothetical protein
MKDMDVYESVRRFVMIDGGSRRAACIEVAKAGTARISSSVSSGKSTPISSGVIPAARYSSTSQAVIRKPRMHGLPDRLSDAEVMTESHSMV